MTLKELLLSTQKRTKSEEDKHALQWLLLEMLDYSYSDFILNENVIKDEVFIKKYYDNVDKYLINNIPVQHIIGYSYFYNRKFLVNEHTLIPRVETEELVYKTINYIKDNFKDIKNLNILDLGTGTGCIGITLKLELGCNVTISDISNEALEIAKLNASNNNVDINIIKSNWLDSITDKYDVIISNPPYIPSNELLEDKVLKEPLNALYSGIDGMDDIDRILSTISSNLTNKSMIVFEHHISQNILLVNIIQKYLNSVKIVQEKDLSNKDRYTFVFI